MGKNIEATIIARIDVVYFANDASLLYGWKSRVGGGMCGGSVRNTQIII